MEDNEFHDNTGGDLIFKGGSQFIIRGNRFLGNSVPLGAAYENKGAAISTEYSRRINISDNFFNNRTVSLDVGTQFHDNDLENSVISIKSGSVSVYNNKGLNTVVDATTSTDPDNYTQSLGGSTVSVFKNNTLSFTQPWDTSIIYSTNNLAVINNNIKVNDAALRHNQLTDPSITNLVLNRTITNMVKADKIVPNTSTPFQGYYRGNRVEGAKANDIYRHNVGWAVYATDLTDEEYSTSLIVDAGFPQKFTIDGIKINGWLDFRLSQYPTDGVGDFHTITVKNSTVNVPSNIDENKGYLNNTYRGSGEKTRLLSTPDGVNANFVFENVNFVTDDTTGQLFMYLGHRGTTKFINCKFKAPVAQTIDLNASGSSGTITNYTSNVNGDVTIIQPEYTNISFNLRSSDREHFFYLGRNSRCIATK
ncbi:hypothetical protein P5P81_00750 [Tritonibacter mobilis]|nr:hypothetical protein [Tritonibacter mobilis]